MHCCHHPRHHINVSPNILSVAHFRLPRFQSEEVEFHVFLLFSFFKHGNFHHWVTHSVQDAWRLRTESQNIYQGNWRLLWRVLSDSPEPATALLHRCRYLSCFAQCSPVSCCSLTLSNCCIPGDKQSLPFQTLPYSNILSYFTKTIGRSKKKKDISNNNTNNQTNKIIIILKLLYIVLKRRTKIPRQSSRLCNVYPYNWWTQQTN